ncbi:MoaD/ThiS family protein [Pirellulaceae bacterium SH501]
MLILLFGGAREVAGVNSVEIKLPCPATISQIAVELGDIRPELKPFINSSRFAVNREIVDLEFVILSDCPNLEVALIPPVSGG